MRLVGVSQRVVVDPRFGERRDALDQRWAPFLLAAGLLPIPLPNQKATALALADSLPLAGFLLTGGQDPVAYGGDAPERDETELALIERARRDRLPLIGVCRGMQVIQHAFGIGLERCTDHAGTRHRVDGGREVNSYHTLAARSSAAGLAVTARAPDGLIEAIRHEAEPIHGLMWHPEREPVPDPLDLALFRRCFGA